MSALNPIKGKSKKETDRGGGEVFEKTEVQGANFNWSKRGKKRGKGKYSLPRRAQGENCIERTEKGKKRALALFRNGDGGNEKEDQKGVQPWGHKAKKRGRMTSLER